MKWIVSFFLIFAAATSISVANTLPPPEGIQIYQKNLQASPSHQQKLAEALYRYNNADDLWEVFRKKFELYHYEDNPLVQAQINYFMNHQEFLLKSANRAAPYLYYILQETEKRNLPAEVALIPIIESAFDPFAYSSEGAAGIWQMMPRTASDYGVKQNFWYDGRRDVITSTKAALTHLTFLRNFFNNNWLLIIAAYDTGQGNVLSAIRRNIRDGYDTSFWSLPVAKETQDYVPRLLALAEIIAHPEKYPVYFPPVRNAPYLAQVDVGMQMDLKRAALLAGITLRRLMQLNPGFNRSITEPNGPYRITVPIENVTQFTKNLAKIPAKALAKLKKYIAHSNIKLAQQKYKDLKSKGIASFQQVFTESAKLKTQIFHAQYKLQPGDTIYMTRKGDSVPAIAKHFKISDADLLAANNVSAQTKLPANERLIIPTHTRIQFSTSKQKTNQFLKPGETLYMVRRGDTFDIIAKRFHTTAPEIRLANLVADNELHEGDRLVIPTKG